MSLTALGAPPALPCRHSRWRKVSEQRGEESEAQLLGASYSFSQGGTGTWGLWKGEISLLQLSTIIGIFSAEQLIFGEYKSHGLLVLLIKHSMIHFRAELLSLLPLKAHTN